MKRSMESILSDEPTVHDLPDEPGSDSQAQGGEDTETVTPAKGKPGATGAAAGAKPAAKAADAAGKGKGTPAGKETETEDEDVEEHVPDDLDGIKRALAAARGDKRKAKKKWQEVEREVAELKGKLAVYRQQGAPKPPESPKAPADVDLTDEEFFGKGPEAVKAYVARTLEKREAEARQRRLVRSEARALKKHPDFRDKFVLFQQSAPPHIVQQMLDEDDPAEFVYEYASTVEQFQGVSSPEEYRKKVEAEVEARLRAEYEERLAAGRPPDDEPPSAPAKPPPPRSLAGVRGNGASTPQAWTGPQPLENLFK